MTTTRGATVAMALFGTLCVGTRADAQRGDSLEVGARYRITLPRFADRPGPQFPQSRWLAGELVERRGDSLIVRPHPTTGNVAVPFASIDRLERSRGVSRAASTFEGAVGGALVGALIGSLLYDLDVRGAGFNSRWQSVGTMAAQVGGAGLVTGLLFPTERWKRVRRPSP